MNGARSGRGLLASAAALLWSPRALAHLDNTTLGPVYDGAWHLLSHPELLLPVLALALVGGQNGPAAGRRALLVLPLAWLAGGLCVAFGPGLGQGLLPLPAAPIGPNVLAALGMLILGLLAAAHPRLRPLAVGVLAWLLGIALACADGATPRAAGGMTVLLGMVGASFLLAAPVAALAVSARAGWPAVAARIAGSWIAAAGLLLLGWSLRG